MNLPLENKIAVVTGGAQGLGQAVCGALAKAGCNVAIADMKDEAAQATAAEIVKATGRKSFALKTDVTQEADVEEVRGAGLCQVRTRAARASLRSRDRAVRYSALRARRIWALLARSARRRSVAARSARRRASSRALVAWRAARMRCDAA